MFVFFNKQQYFCNVFIDFLLHLEEEAPSTTCDANLHWRSACCLPADLSTVNALHHIF